MKETKYKKYNRNESYKVKWAKEEHTCEKCGKVMTEYYGSGRFCCKSCANSHERTEESKLKTSRSVKSTMKAKKSNNSTNKYNFSEYVNGTEELYIKGLIKQKHLHLYKKSKQLNIDFVICPYCKLRFTELQQKHLNQHDKTKQDVLSEFENEYPLISKKTYDKRSAASVALHQKLKIENRFKGWQTRNIKSYAEIFWESVLQNNQIDYIKEYVVKKRSLGLEDVSNYFLDFLIDGYIDLEIDGKQHRYKDRKENDKIRDELLSENGFVIYRIPWINPKNKEAVKQQIDEFLQWYANVSKNNLLDCC